jgi:hypothetical protein
MNKPSVDKIKLVLYEQKNTGTLRKKNYEWVLIKERMFDIMNDLGCINICFDVGRKTFLVSAHPYSNEFLEYLKRKETK